MQIEELQDVRASKVLAASSQELGASWNPHSVTCPYKKSWTAVFWSESGQRAQDTKITLWKWTSFIWIIRHARRWTCSTCQQSLPDKVLLSSCNSCKGLSASAICLSLYPYPFGLPRHQDISLRTFLLCMLSRVTIIRRLWKTKRQTKAASCAHQLTGRRHLSSHRRGSWYCRCGRRDQFNLFDCSRRKVLAWPPSGLTDILSVCSSATATTWYDMIQCMISETSTSTSSMFLEVL